VKFTDRHPLQEASSKLTLATLATLAGGHPQTAKSTLQPRLVHHHTHTIDIISVSGEGQVEAASPTPAKPAKVAKPESLLMRDGRRLWCIRAGDIPAAVDGATRAAVDEACHFGCVLVADGADLVLVEPWLSRLPGGVRDALTTNAGAVIALLRGESLARTEEGVQRGGVVRPPNGHV